VTMQDMSRATVQDGIELEYETFGSSDDAPMLLVMGLGGQMTAWDPEFCQRLVGEGFYVIRYDNRDVGLSTRVAPEGFDLNRAIAAAFTGGQIEPPYRLADMAADAVGLLDHLGIDSSHVVGVSMGGMIVQTLAIEHAGRVRSVSSIMSTTGDRSVGQATAEAAALLSRPPASARDEYVESTVEAEHLLNGGVVPVDEERVRRRAEHAWERSYDPAGVGRQLVAILGSPDRTAALGSVTVPFQVLHGDKDPLVGYSGGEATAKAVPDAELVTIEGMGHNLPVVFWDQVVAAIVDHARKAV
jgi:pimeloyl-ACP methyl ester carboxylesterase